MRRMMFCILANAVALTALPLQGQGCDSLVCSGGMCSALATAPQSGPPLYSGLAVFLTNSSNANCSPTYAFDGAAAPAGRFTVPLMGTAVGGPPNLCSWRLRPVNGVNHFCSFDESDGLPVELLDFEVVLTEEAQHDTPDSRGDEHGNR